MPRKILMVDSDPRLVKLCQLILQHEGYQVTGAFSGDQCLDSLCHSPYDLILLDPLIDNTHGWSLASIIQSNMTWAQVPIMLLTSLDPDQVNRQCSDRTLAIAGFLSKPFPTANLIKHINEVLHQPAWGA